MWRIIAQIFEDIEIMLIESLRRNLSRHIEWEKKEGFSWPAWQALKLREIGRFRKENKQIMEHYTDTISDDIRELLEDQFEEGYHDTEDDLEELGLVSPVSEENFFGINKDRVDKLAEEIIAKESNIEKAALRFMDDVYRRTLYKAEVAMSAGAVTLPQAIDMATRDFLNAGINCIEYKDGRRVNIADYVQMALRTAATRSYLNGAAAKRAELGIDTVLVSQYGACSETCLPWQGRVYIDDVWGVFEGERSGEMGKSKNGNWYPLLSVAIKGGLYHPNCRHSHTTWIEGVSKLPTALDPKKTGENYKLEQQQRKLEREIRKLKRLNTGSLSAGNEKLYQDQIKAKQKELREFVNKHSDVLRRDYWRERVYDISVDKTTDDGILSDRKRVTGALDPYSKKAAEHANRYYEAVRRMKTDTLRIAENTGYKPKNISKVKSHLFMEKHDLGRDELDFFDADYHIAQSWQRLIDGKNIQESDIVLLKHEIAERALMLRGYSYQEAHNRANKRYNYTELLNPK